MPDEAEALWAAAREAFREYPIPYDPDSTARDAIADFILSAAGVPGTPGERLAMIKGIPHRWNGVEYIPEPLKAALDNTPAPPFTDEDVERVAEAIKHAAKVRPMANGQDLAKYVDSVYRAYADAALRAFTRTDGQ